MALEIERKFLVKALDSESQHVKFRIIQGYLCGMPDKVIRVRKKDDHAFITIKGPSRGNVRHEFEYEINADDAQFMLENMCGGRIVEKIRHIIMDDGNLWEVDEFLGANQGLVLAEIELKDPEDTFSFPEWLGMEVSDDHRYRNSYLAEHPYKSWNKFNE